MDKDQVARVTKENPSSPTILPLSYTASNKFVLRSFNSPGLFGSNVVELWGISSDLNLDLCVKDFDSNDSRDRFMANVEFAIREWVVRGGFSLKNRGRETWPPYMYSPIIDSYTKEY